MPSRVTFTALQMAIAFGDEKALKGVGDEKSHLRITPVLEIGAVVRYQDPVLLGN